MIRRLLPQLAFALLAVATVGAYFISQALKTALPLISFSPPPTPVPASIDPIHGRSCLSSKGTWLDYRHTQLKIETSATGTVGVYIVSAKKQFGPAIATVSAGTPMRRSVPGTRQWFPRTFTWNGRLADGQFAPDGTYYFRIVLETQDRSINLSDAPVQIVTKPAIARVTGVSLLGRRTAPAGALVYTPPHGTLKISYIAGQYRRLRIDVYRTDVNGRPQRVWTVPADPKGTWARWSGEIDRRPAPAGTYLFGTTAENLACDPNSWPVAMPPAAGTTPHAGVEVRYLTVTPPLTPTVSGSRASVAVYSPEGGYAWTLRASGSSKVLAQSFGAAGNTRIRVRMPRHRPGLYTLVVRSGTQSAAVPLVASQAGRAAARARVLVVLPMLSWMGASPVDDTGDGLPDTLARGDTVALTRPLVDGPPASIAADASLLTYLRAEHLQYQLTTDVALAEGRGPSLVDRWGVLFPDGERFVPASLASTLRGFVRAGARVMALGTGALSGISAVSGPPSDAQAAAPTVGATDPFGARHGPITPTGGELITELTDQLGLLADSPAFSGFSHYQPIEPPRSSAVSAAGIGDNSVAIVAYRYGSGDVIEVGLPNFGTSLADNVDSQDLIMSAWRILANRN